jgi:hypothetical protein
VYANQAALLRDGSIATVAAYLAQGYATLVFIFDPELSPRVFARHQRRLRIVPAALGYYAGVLGAVALAKERSL